MRKKLKDTGGLTLIELLCATFILVLLVLMLGTGLRMAFRSYQSLTAESETQLLLNSLSDALTDKLRYCIVTETPPVAPATESTYTWSIGTVSVSGDPVDPTASDAIPKGVVLVNDSRLLPDGAYGSRKYQVTTSSGDILTYDKDNHSFKINLTVEDTKLNIIQTAELTVRCLSPVNR